MVEDPEVAAPGTMSDQTNGNGGQMNERLIAEGGEDSPSKTPPPFSPLQALAFILYNIIAVGLVQLLGWAGLGQKDPWIPNLTVLQFTAIIASAIQIIAFVPAFIYQTEKYYDLTGMFTYLICVWYSFAAGYEASIERKGNKIDARAIIASCFVTVWTLRLGTFLFNRILQSKKDGRFDHLKPNFLRYFVVWNIQGLWIFLGCMPTFILNSTQQDAGFQWTDAVGGTLFVLGFIGEVVADEQKKHFNSRPENKGKWIDFGLWRYSRHPNYFFEWLLQFGLFVLCLAEFQNSQWVAVLSPVFLFILLAFISGVPLLEKRADEKWGGKPEYEEYKRVTSICIPLPRLPAAYDIRTTLFCWLGGALV